MKELNGYELSRSWFDFCFEHPEKISPNHTALYFFCIEHCNRLGWKKKFGLPTSMSKEAIGIKSYKTYIKTFNDLVDWGFIEIVEKSKNQYSANIIAIVKNTKAHTKALDKAILKHVSKQVQGTGESIASIDKPLTINKEQELLELLDNELLEEINLKGLLMKDYKLENCKLDKGTFDFSVMETASRLFAGFKKHQPNNKDLDFITYGEWIKPVRFMMKSKKYTQGQILEVIQFASNGWWKTKVLNTKDLDSNFEKIKAQYHDTGNS